MTNKKKQSRPTGISGRTFPRKAFTRSEEMLLRNFVDQAGKLVWPALWKSSNVALLDKDSGYEVPRLDDFSNPIAQALSVRNQIIESLASGATVATTRLVNSALFSREPTMSFGAAFKEAVSVGVSFQGQTFEDDATDDDDDDDKVPTVSESVRKQRAADELSRFGRLPILIAAKFWETPESLNSVDWTSSTVEIAPKYLRVIHKSETRALSAGSLMYTHSPLKVTVSMRDPWVSLAKLYDLPPVPDELALAQYAEFRAAFWPELMAAGWRAVAISRPADNALAATWVARLTATWVAERMKEYLKMRGYVEEEDSVPHDPRPNVMPDFSSLRSRAAQIVGQLKRGDKSLTAPVMVLTGRIR
jgi:hypothetical protein